MRFLIHPHATAVLIRQDIPRFQSLHTAIETLANAEEELEETIWDVVEHVDDGRGEEEGERAGFATVWAKFRIVKAGMVSILKHVAPCCVLPSPFLHRLCIIYELPLPFAKPIGTFSK